MQHAIQWPPPQWLMSFPKYVIVHAIVNEILHSLGFRAMCSLFLERKSRFFPPLYPNLCFPRLLCENKVHLAFRRKVLPIGTHVQYIF